MRQIQAIRGMNDILADETPYWEYLEKALRELAKQYGYAEIRFPILESTELFQRTIGEVTDIVEKEMYTFTDKSGDSMTLRPEGTAGCARAMLQHGLLYNQIQRLWYIGPMFRHERPQRGRYRQFHQFGIEAFGLEGPEIDAEQIFLSARLWKILQIEAKVKLQINSLGNAESRACHRQDLVTYFTKHIELLDEDSKRRLHTNPLRILDSKNPQLQNLITKAPSLLDYLDEVAKKHFTKLCELLDGAKISYTINPRLVRGLDYYCYTVFEWVTEIESAQNAICAGGRYDNLTAQLGCDPIPACGFALGIERLIELLKTNLICKNVPDAYLVLVGEQARKYGMVFAEIIREQIPTLSLLTDCKGGNFKSQFKRADKSGARYAIVIGDDEVTKDVITIKDLRGDTPQETLDFARAVEFFEKI